MIACAIYEATFNFVLFDFDIWMDEEYHTAADEVKHKNELCVSQPQTWCHAIQQDDFWNFLKFSS